MRLDAAEVAAAFDLLRLPDSFYDDPFPTYRALRERSPVKRLPSGGVFLTRYDDIVAVYKDVASFSSDKHEEFFPKYGATPLFEHHTTSLVFNDPPLHTRVRRLIAGALTPKHVAAMEARLIELVEGLLDAMAAQGKGAEIDLIEAFCAAIPVESIGNLLARAACSSSGFRCVGWSLAILERA